MTPVTLVIVLVIGLVAGVVGGLAGIGGSIVMLPALGVVLGYASADKSEQHTYTAAAMVVNAVVAGSSTWQHLKAKAVRSKLLWQLAPAMVAGIVIGVLLSFPAGGPALKIGLAVFLIAYCVYTGVSGLMGAREDDPSRERAAPPAVIGAGLVTGVAAGFLGIGGGILLVPVLTLGLRVPTRQAIATTAAAMLISSPVGAALKLSLLNREGLAWADAVWIAVPMAAGAFVGAPIGASLTHKLKLPALKLVISVVLAIAGVRLVFSGGDKTEAGTIEAETLPERQPETDSTGR